MTTMSFPLALAVALLAGAPTVEGHGRMTVPAARNGNDNGCVAGGPGTVHAFGASGQEKYQHGVCGNAPGTAQTFNRVGDVQATYTAGSVIEIEAQITAHHVGYFEVDLCLDAGDLSEECFDAQHLLRAGCNCTCPGDASNSCEACNECRWHWKALMEGELSQSVAQGYQGPVLPGGGNLMPYNFKMFYALPAGLKSRNAVLRWHYMTTNSCTSGASAPEEFWNCADVAIQDESGDAGPAISYDNAALESMPVNNLMPAINSGSLKGVSHACPVDAAGGLLGVGTASEYHCGEAREDQGPYEYCTSASGGSGSFDCEGVAGGAVNCQEECSPWYFQCANGVAYQKPTPSGTMCKENNFVLASACDGLQPSPTPASTPAPTPTPATPSPTPATTPAPTPMPATPSPTPAPTSATTPAPTPASTASPTLAPTPAPTASAPGGLDPRCSEHSCGACLANNNVCYSTEKAWCDLYALYTWCGGSSSLLQEAAGAPRRARRARKLRGGSLQPGAAPR